jgi:phage terminase Nu1 subunit (DNA packaging protein)
MASLGATAAADPATSATGADAIARYALAKAILTEHQGRIAEAKAAMLEGSLIDAELVRMQRAREGAAIQSAVMSLAASVSHELVGLDVAAIHARLDRWSRDTLLSVASGEWEEDIDAGGDAGEGDDDA